MNQRPDDVLAALSPLLDHALDMAPAERAAWLAELRADRPELAAELAALLAREADPATRGFLGSEPPGGWFRPAVGDPPVAGAEFGAYSLVRLLDEGGMGSVWLARRSDGRFEGDVAIKLLGAALLTGAGAERFRREGSALARLAHPNIARLLDAGVTGGGQPYLVLEYVDGIRIDRWCDERALAPHDRISLFQQVLAAVAHAHANLVVHRDVKPSNILVTSDGTVKLLDFGIAKLLEDGATGEHTELTAAGGLPLTPEYAAPEQVTGAAITTATDVYSLGVLLYLLLAGRHPTAPGRSGSIEHLRAVVDTDPARLSTAAAAAAAAAPEAAMARASTGDRLRRLYAGDLDNILGKTLRKSPAERYQSAAALADDLRRFLRSEPVSARADSMAYRAGKFLRRNRLAAAAAVIIAVALLGLTGFSFAQMREARLQRDAARYQSRRAEAQIEFQSLLMSQVGDGPMTMREIVDRGRETVEREYAGEPRFLAAMLLQLARRYSELGDGPQQLQLLGHADSLAATAGAIAELAEIRCDRVAYLRNEGEYDSAWAALAAADSLRHRARDPIVDEWCLQVRADLAAEVNRPVEAGAAIREALGSMERGGRVGEPAYFAMLASLANVLNAEDRLRESAAVGHRILAGLDRSGRGGTVTRMVANHNLAVTLSELGETAEAERRFHDVVVTAAASDASGYVHPQPLIHYAETALMQDRADSAAKYFAILVAQAERDSSRYWHGRGTFGLARAQARLGDLAAAAVTAETFRRLRKDFSRLTSTDDQLPDTLALEGWLALAAGDTARADALFLGSLRHYDFFDGTKQKQQRAVALQAAETALVLGRPDSALALARLAGAIASRDSLAEARSGYVGAARLIEGRALLARGDSEAAAEAIGRAAAALRTGYGAAHPRTREAESILAHLRSAVR